MSEEIYYKYCCGCETYINENQINIDSDYCFECILILYYDEYFEILENLFGKDITLNILEFI